MKMSKATIRGINLTQLLRIHCKDVPGDNIVLVVTLGAGAVETMPGSDRDKGYRSGGQLATMNGVHGRRPRHQPGY